MEVEEGHPSLGQRSHLGRWGSVVTWRSAEGTSAEFLFLKRERDLNVSSSLRRESVSLCFISLCAYQSI